MPYTSACVRECLQAAGIGCAITTYTQSRNLLYDITDDAFFYDLILLDIEMPGICGMEIPQQDPRAFYPHARIIFVTSHAEYAIDAFELSIFRYVPKNNLETKLPAAVIDAARLIELEAGQEYTIQTASRMEKIPLQGYILRPAGWQKRHASCPAPGLPKCRKSLQQVFDELDTPEFIFVDRGCIVNILHIMKISGSTAILKNGEPLPISRSHLQEVKQNNQSVLGSAHMMEYVPMISYFLTNEMRLLCGLFLVARVMHFLPKRKLLLLSAAGGVPVTALQMAGWPAMGVLTVEWLVITAVAWHCLRGKLNLCLFLVFFYEVGVGLWDFLLQAGLGIAFRSENFVHPNAMESLAGIWLVRLLMAIGAIPLIKQDQPNAGTLRALSVLVILGMVGAVTLSEQTILPLDEDLVGTWVILSVILLFAILFYRVNQQREMEAEIAKLKQEQAEIVERDYQALRRTYADNAKLYHDLHNHIEAIYQCLIQGDTQAAIRYCEDLRTPMRQISQTIWTGDKALDCLISSKMALAEQEQIKTKVNIEYPHNTNIRSVDLTTILGNLLDNALEAAKAAPEGLRFLNLTIRRINAMLIIKVENGYGNAPIQENGTLLTAKKDKAFHGWGLKSVQTAADRYDGAISTHYKDHVFQSVVTLSFQPVKTA